MLAAAKYVRNNEWIPDSIHQKKGFFLHLWIMISHRNCVLQLLTCVRRDCYIDHCTLSSGEVPKLWRHVLLLLGGCRFFPISRLIIQHLIKRMFRRCDITRSAQWNGFLFCRMFQSVPLSTTSCAECICMQFLFVQDATEQMSEWELDVMHSVRIIIIMEWHSRVPLMLWYHIRMVVRITHSLSLQLI